MNEWWPTRKCFYRPCIWFFCMFTHMTRRPKAEMPLSYRHERRPRNVSYWYFIIYYFWMIDQFLIGGIHKVNDDKTPSVKKQNKMTLSTIWYLHLPKIIFLWISIYFELRRTTLLFLYFFLLKNEMGQRVSSSMPIMAFFFNNLKWVCMCVDKNVRITVYRQHSI